MLTHLQNRVNLIFNTYRNLPENYFSSLFVPLLIVEFFSFVIASTLKYGSYKFNQIIHSDLHSMYLNTDFFEKINDLQFFFPAVNILTFALFIPFFRKQFDLNGHSQTITDFISKTSVSKWNIYLLFLSIIFILSLTPYCYGNYNYYLTWFFYNQNSDENILKSIAGLFHMLANLLPYLFAAILAFSDGEGMKVLIKNKFIILSSFLLIITIKILTTHFAAQSSYHLQQFLAIPFKTSRIAIILSFILQWFVYFLIIPSKIVSLQKSDEILSSENVLIKTKRATSLDDEVLDELI